MKKLLVSLAATGVLVAGAFVASSVTSSAADAQTTDTTATEQPQRPVRGAILDEVLGGLVSDGTINQSQADAVKGALQAKIAELRGKIGDRDPAARAERRGILRGLLADGVITAEEIAELPEDHPLRTGDSKFSELLEDDGQITREEIQSFFEAQRAEREANAGATG
ncbi:MAG: hypothetical protein ACC654_03280 [Acidimicrobiia bacterium]